MMAPILRDEVIIGVEPDGADGKFRPRRPAWRRDGGPDVGDPRQLSFGTGCRTAGWKGSYNWLMAPPLAPVKAAPSHGIARWNALSVVEVLWVKNMKQRLAYLGA
jgi:hypothetical protein